MGWGDIIDTFFFVGVGSVVVETTVSMSVEVPVLISMTGGVEDAIGVLDVAICCVDVALVEVEAPSTRPLPPPPPEPPEAFVETLGFPKDFKMLTQLFWDAAVTA